MYLAVQWALRRTDVAGSEKLTLVGICEHAGTDDLSAWPSVDTLADYGSCTRRQAQRAIRSLADRGLIRIEERGGGTARTPASMRPNRYWPIIDPTSFAIAADGYPRDADVAPPPVPRDAHVAPPRDAYVAPPVTPMSPEPPTEPPCLTLSVEEHARPDPFETWWTTYPRHVAKDRARTAYRAAANDVGIMSISAGTGAWVVYWKAARTEATYIPHPTTFLNQRRFLDLPPQLPLDRRARSVLGGRPVVLDEDRDGPSGRMTL